MFFLSLLLLLLCNGLQIDKLKKRLAARSKKLKVGQEEGEEGEEEGAKAEEEAEEEKEGDPM